MPNLAGTWTVYRVLAKTAHVVKDTTSITISSTNDDFSFTKDGENQATPVTPTSVTRNATSYKGSNGSYELNVQTTGSNSVLTGYVKDLTSGAISSIGGVVSSGTPPEIADARYLLKTRIHSGSGAVADTANLLITRLKGVRFIVLFLRDGKPVALNPVFSPDGTSLTAEGSYKNSNLQMALRSIPTQGTVTYLSGHITWKGGVGALADGISGPDDADSFVAVRAGSAPVDKDTMEPGDEDIDGR